MLVVVSMLRIRLENLSLPYWPAQEELKQQSVKRLVGIVMRSGIGDSIASKEDC